MTLTPARNLPRPNPSPRLVRGLLSEHAILFLCLLYFAGAWFLVPGLTSPDNLSNLAVNQLPLLALCLGQMIVILTGGIDLSVAAIIAMSSIAGGYVMNGENGLLANHPAAVPVAISVMLAVGLLLGFLNGAAITLLAMPPFIVTLATNMTVAALAVWSTQSKNYGDLPASFVEIGFGTIFGIPYAALIVAALAIILALVLSRTLYGRWLYAAGQNIKTARISGVPVRPIACSAYVASGFCAAVASVLMTARLETASPTLGREILLDVIGAVVIGGTSLLGGRGKALWTLYGVLLFSLISNTLNFVGLQHFTIMIVKGAVILAAAAIDTLRRRVIAS